MPAPTKPGNEVSRLRDLILQNFDAFGFRKRQWKEIAEEEHCSLRSLMRQVQELRNAGAIPKPKRVGEHARGRTAKPAKFRKAGMEASKLDGIVNLKGALTREERISHLSEIVENGADLPRIQAIKLLEDLERASGLQYGPPPPTTKADTTALIVELLLSIKPDWVQEALNEYNRALEAKENPPETAESVPSDPSSSDVGGRST